ncbi:TonB-dependent receptor [soil metagenome]
MRLLSTILFFFFTTTNLLAQVTIKGAVKDEKGNGLPGCNIIIKDTYDGTVTDSLGRFTFKTSEKGEITLVIKSMGFKSMEQKITLGTETITLNFTLKEELNELNAVDITVGSFEAGDKKRATVLKMLDIVTTAGANADISATIQTLPGAQKVGESEGLYVRGGSAEESKIIIDGTVVNNFFFSAVPGIAQRGRFSPFLFKGTTFTSGGYSALYGQALSAVLSMESVDLPDRSEVQAGFSPIFVNTGFQELNKAKNSSWGGSYAYTNLVLYTKIVDQQPDIFKAPEAHNLDANYRYKTKNGSFFKVYAYFNSNEVGLRRPDLDSLGLKNSFRLKNQNFFTNASWRQYLGKSWKLFCVTSYSYNQDEILGELQNDANTQIPVTGIPDLDYKKFNLNAQKEMLQFRTVVDRFFGALNAIRIGAEVWKNFDKNNTQLYNGNYTGKVTENYGAAFVESDLYLNNNLAFRPGIRFEFDDLNQKSNIAPRASLSYKLAKKSTMSFDYGIFYQTPDRKYFTDNKELDFARADHYILTWQYLDISYTLRAQIFYKDYRNLVKTDADNFAATGVNGNGYAQGLEVFWRDKKTIKGMDYWISYSYLDTKRNYLNFPISAQPNFAANHNGSVVIKKFWVKHMFGINWSYNWATGRPYYNPNKTEPDYLSDRTIAYQSNNFSFNWITKVAKANAVVVVGVNNVFNQPQIFGYNYSNRVKDEAGNLIRAEINPPASRGYFLGLFLSWGVDRTKQNIDNNL